MNREWRNKIEGDSESEDESEQAGETRPAQENERQQKYYRSMVVRRHILLNQPQALEVRTKTKGGRMS